MSYIWKLKAERKKERNVLRLHPGEVTVEETRVFCQHAVFTTLYTDMTLHPVYTLKCRYTRSSINYLQEVKSCLVSKWNDKHLKARVNWFMLQFLVCVCIDEDICVCVCVDIPICLHQCVYMI